MNIQKRTYFKWIRGKKITILNKFKKKIKFEILREIKLRV